MRQGLTGSPVASSELLPMKGDLASDPTGSAVVILVKTKSDRCAVDEDVRIRQVAHAQPEFPFLITCQETQAGIGYPVALDQTGWVIQRL